jgi:hypothetical protein
MRESLVRASCIRLGPSRLMLRHGAALAIVGFSLIVPPLQKDDQTHIDMIAPFAQWVVEQRYDTEEAY